ncbi:MAG: SufE family protein [Paludibacteraceae bacterium]|nr:SufE family protein [Candidatus Colousia faecequi]MCQ2337943.1 SufE family protein [Paludibacteraceae bacterium]
MEKSLEERVAEIEEDFGELGEWMDKYQYLVELGKETDTLSEEEKNDETLIRGCQSQVWILAERRDGRIYFRGDGDAIIVKGIVSLLMKAVSGCTVEEVRGCDFSFVERIGLREHLTPTRSNGVLSMIERIKRLAE